MARFALLHLVLRGKEGEHMCPLLGLIGTNVRARVRIRIRIRIRARARSAGTRIRVSRG